MIGNEKRNNALAFAAFGAITVLSGCSYELYRPPVGGVADMSVPEAQKCVEDTLVLYSEPAYGFCPGGGGGDKIRTAKVTLDRIMLTLSSKCVVSYDLRDLDPALKLVNSQNTYVMATPVRGMAAVSGDRGQDPALRRLVDALVRLKEEALHPTLPAIEQARFEDALAAYRAVAVKPELPEEVRRFKIQAELAVREKRFADAADLYADGLKVSPWWPEGRYNRALVLAQLGEYPGAIKEMGRYLALAPDSSNARTAQDTIYRWQAEVNAAPPSR